MIPESTTDGLESITEGLANLTSGVGDNMLAVSVLSTGTQALILGDTTISMGKVIVVSS